MLVFAHRGVSAYHVDNSITAIKKAVLWQLPIEIDVQMSRDGIFYVYHDYHIENLETLLPELESEVIDSILIEGEKIPRFIEVLKLIPDNLLLNVEIKQLGLDTRDITEELYTMMKTHHNLENIIVSSFNHHVLYEMRQLDGHLKIGLLFGQVVKSFSDYIKMSAIKPTSIHLGLEVVSYDLVKQLHAMNLPVYVYTVNTKDIYDRVVLMAVDGIFTNYPDKIGGANGTG